MEAERTHPPYDRIDGLGEDDERAVVAHRRPITAGSPVHVKDAQDMVPSDVLAVWNDQSDPHVVAQEPGVQNACVGRHPEDDESGQDPDILPESWRRRGLLPHRRWGKACPPIREKSSD